MKNSSDLNCENYPWFLNLGGSTMVWTDPFFSYLEWFLGLKNRNSERFPVNQVRLYDPGLKNHDYEMVIKALGDHASSMASYADLLNDARFISRSFSHLR